MGFPVPVTSNTFYALNPDGSKKWEFKTLDGDANSKIYSTPALAQDGTIFLEAGPQTQEFTLWINLEI